MVIIKSVDENRNSTSITDDSELYFPVGINETWCVTAVIYCKVGVPKITIAAPAGSMGEWHELQGYNYTSQSLGATLRETSNYDVLVEASVITGSTAGNISLQWGQNTAGATVTIGKYSSIAAIKKA